MIFIWKIDKLDFIACVNAFFGVIFISVKIGLLIAVSVSFAKIILKATRPCTAILGKISQTSFFRNTQQYPDALKVPGVLIISVESAIYLSNSNYIKERILRWLNFERFPLISAVTVIDTSGIRALEELHKSMQKKDIQLSLANPGQGVIDKLHAAKSEDLTGEDKISLSITDAVLTCSPRFERLP